MIVYDDVNKPRIVHFKKIIKDNKIKLFLNDEFVDELDIESMNEIIVHNILTVDNNDVLTFISDNVTIKIDGKSFQTIVEKSDKIFNSNDIHTISIGVQTNNNVDRQLSVTDVTGNCIDFINKQYAIYQISTFFKEIIVIKIDNNDWMTMEELEQKGILKLK